MFAVFAGGLGEFIYTHMLRADNQNEKDFLTPFKQKFDTIVHQFKQMYRELIYDASLLDVPEASLILETMVANIIASQRDQRMVTDKLTVVSKGISPLQEALSDSAVKDVLEAIDMRAPQSGMDLNSTVYQALNRLRIEPVFYHMLPCSGGKLKKYVMLKKLLL
jgi:hypothetical protein